MPTKVARRGSLKISPPTPLAKRLVRTVLGFGVGIGVGLAPFLGNLDIPLFLPLLSLFPITLREFLLPTSAFLMGVIAAGTQFYSGFNLASNASRYYAKRALAVISGSLLLLLFLYVNFVETVHFDENRTVSYVIGLERKASCSCDKDASDADCIFKRSANPNGIEGCWPKTQVALGEFSLSVVYLFLTGSFAFFVGLLLLQESAKSKRNAPQKIR